MANVFYKLYIHGVPHDKTMDDVVYAIEYGLSLSPRVEMHGVVGTGFGRGQVQVILPIPLTREQEANLLRSFVRNLGTSKFFDDYGNQVRVEGL